MFSSVWLEHLPYKQRVIGSSPITSTIDRKSINWMFSSVWLEHLPYKQRVIGSSPITSTISRAKLGCFFYFCLLNLLHYFGVVSIFSLIIFYFKALIFLN